MLQAINDCNLPKFTAPDQVIFKDLTSDLFPQSLLQLVEARGDMPQGAALVAPSASSSAEQGESGGGAAMDDVPLPPFADRLATGIKNACRSSGLVPTARFHAKCEELQMTFTVRHGVMLVGEAASGKTCVYRTLARALNVLAVQPGHVVDRGDGDVLGGTNQKYVTATTRPIRNM